MDSESGTKLFLGSTWGSGGISLHSRMTRVKRDIRIGGTGCARSIKEKGIYRESAGCSICGSCADIGRSVQARMDINRHTYACGLNCFIISRSFKGIKYSPAEPEPGGILANQLWLIS